MQQHAEDDGQHREDGEFGRDHPPDIALAEPGEARRILCVGLVAEDDIGDAAEEAHRADGGDDRRNLKAGDQEAVEGAAEQADAEADGDDHRRVEAGGAGGTHRGRGQRDDRGDGEVDIAGDDHERHRQRDDRLFGEVVGRVRKVPGIKEIGRGERVEDEDQDRNGEEQCLPAREDAAPAERSAGPEWCAASTSRRRGSSGRTSCSCVDLRFLQDQPTDLALAAGIDHDRDNDDGAGNGHLPEGRDVNDGEGVLDDAKEERTQHAADDGADAAGDRNAADDTGCNRIKLEALCDLHIGDSIARDPEIAGEAGDRATDRIGVEARAADIDAGIDRCGRVAAGGEERPAHAGHLEEYGDQQHRDDGKPAEYGQAEEYRARDGLEGVAHLVGVDPGAARKHEHRAAIDRHRAEGHDDRRNAELPDEQAVDRAENAAGDDGNADQRDHRDLRDSRNSASPRSCR